MSIKDEAEQGKCGLMVVFSSCLKNVERHRILPMCTQYLQGKFKHDYYGLESLNHIEGMQPIFIESGGLDLKAIKGSGGQSHGNSYQLVNI